MKRVKCKYWKVCGNYKVGSYTCNHEQEAEDYCGIKIGFENGRTI